MKFARAGHLLTSQELSALYKPVSQSLSSLDYDTKTFFSILNAVCLGQWLYAAMEYLATKSSAHGYTTAIEIFNIHNLGSPFSVCFEEI